MNLHIYIERERDPLRLGLDHRAVAHAVRRDPHIIYIYIYIHTHMHTDLYIYIYIYTHTRYSYY